MQLWYFLCLMPFYYLQSSYTTTLPSCALDWFYTYCWSKQFVEVMTNVSFGTAERFINYWNWVCLKWLIIVDCAGQFYRTKCAKVDSCVLSMQPWRCCCHGDIWQILFIVVDSSVLFMYAQLPLSFDHSVMHWLNSGLFLVTTTISKCFSSQSAPPIMH